MHDSVFTQIIKGEIPCHKVYEDEKTFAFLDIRPIQPGNVLVIPKKQVAYVWDLPQEDYDALMHTVQKIGKRLQEVFAHRNRIGMQVEGLEVNHAHVKVFPFDTAGEFRANPQDVPAPSREELEAMATQLRIKDEI